MKYCDVMSEAIKMQDIADDIMFIVKSLENKQITKKEVIDQLKLIADYQYMKTLRLCNIFESFYLNNK